MKFSFLKLSTVLSSLLIITACANSHQCKLGDACFGIEDAYEAALIDGGNEESVLPEYSNKGKGKKINNDYKTEDEYLLLQGFSSYAGSKLTDRPIYQPPRPIRIWIAPWQANLDSYTQKDPVLMGDQFLYATIPGYWQMGELRGEGQVNRMLTLEPRINTPESKQNANRVNPRQTLFEAE